MELSDSKTSYRRIQFSLERARIISTYFIKQSLPFSSLYAAYFEKAFTA